MKLDFDTKILNLIRNLKIEGKTDKEVSEILGIHPNKLVLYKKSVTGLKEAIEEGKAAGREIANDAVERALFERATGYSYIEKVVDSKGKGQICERHAPPDIGAIKFWLKNKNPSEWRESQDVNHGVTPSTHALIVQGLQELDEPEQSEIAQLED